MKPKMTTNTLFAIDLPLVKTNEELEKAKEMHLKYDQYFITSGCCKERRRIFNKLWKKHKPYADKHFLKEIQTKFHQRSWEMYISNVLLEKKLTIHSQNEGPDFIIDNLAYIECVAPTKGDPAKPDSVPKMFVATTPKEIMALNVPVDKMILRITGAIEYKAVKQYKNWKSKKWFNSKMPFIIAINTGDLEYVENPSMPNVLMALFGFQFLQISKKTGTTTFSQRNNIGKSNNKLVPVNYFRNENFSFVSGVLFSDKSVLNHPENIGEDCVFVNNPFADNPVSESFVKLFRNCGK